MKRLFLACLVGLPLLQACGPMQIRDVQTRAWVPIHVGTLEVHRDIVIPGGRTRVSFQHGKQISGINEFEPFCHLEVTTLSDSPRTVHPGIFTITAVSGRMEQIVESTTLMLAALDSVAAVNDGDSGGPTRITRMLNFRLHANAQPDVRRLSCGGGFDDPSDADPPSLQDIAAALGTNATLTVQ